MTENGRKPAFTVDVQSEYPNNRGLTKREYFAAHALGGMAGSPLFEFESAEFMAESAVISADALLAALDTKP